MSTGQSNSRVSEVDITVREANQIEREQIERDAPLASDACVIVALGKKIIGWGDDYGTFHPLIGGEALELAALQGRGEALLDAALVFYEEAGGRR